jgi:two-component system LytT family sensor kinase
MLSKSNFYKPINVKLSAAALLICISGAQFYWLWQEKEFALEIAALDAFGSYLLLYALFMFIDYSMTYYLPPTSRYIIIGIQSLLLSIGWVFVCGWSFLYYFFDDRVYMAFWNDTIYIRGLLGWILLADFSVINHLISRISKDQESLEQSQIMERLRKEAELYKLRQQLHPHFLFNSLNSINALIGREPKQARNMVLQLSDFLRHTLKKEDNDFISFAEELEDLRLYLSIEQVRFGHRLVIEEDIALECNQYKIPPFLLQPLVENAIKYGLYGMIGKVVIHLKAIVDQQQIIFTIINPFDPDAVAPKGTGFGLEGVQRRLYLLFARNDLLIAAPMPTAATDEETAGLKMFKAEIRIPIQSTQSNHI